MKNKSQSSDKKLKQARLPFKILSPRSPGVDQASVAKKRKLSNSTQDPQEVIKKVFVKENIDNSNEVEIISDEIIEDANLRVKSVKSSINPVVYLVDNVEELIQQSKLSDSKVEDIIDVSDNSNSSKEHSIEPLIFDEGSGRASNGNSNSELKTPQKAKVSSADDDDDDDDDTPSTAENDTANIIKNQDSKTPTQIKKTPKQKHQESAKKKEEKEKARLERERLKQEEKDQRFKQRQDKDEQKRKEREDKEEQRKKEKEEKDEQRRKEKEEREKKRLAEIEMKNEERRMKEEDKRKKDELREEKLRREKQEKEEAEQKQKKAAAAFVNFFVPKKVNFDKNEESNINNEDSEAEKDKHNFMPFSLKADMRLAPIIRHSINSDRKKRLDSILSSEVVNKQLYIEAIKAPTYAVGKSWKTWEFSEKDVLIIAEEGEAIVESYTAIQHNRPKLLQFHENKRPPYWGTWTKTSCSVGPRTPFGQDKILDYEVDSDSEWEEEEPGESLHGSDDEKEKDETEDEYEVDNDFFVPHGYLSDEEQDNAEEIDSTSPETLKVKLKMLQTEFNEEMKKKTEKIKPRLFGCIWSNGDGSKPEKCVDSIWNMLQQNAMIYESAIILAPPQNDALVDSENTPGPGAKLTKLPEVLLPDLIKLIHGNECSRSFMIKEFYAYILKHCQNIQKQDISKSAIGRKIHEIAKYITVKEDASGSSKRCWFVGQSSRDAYNMSELPIANTWVYILKHRRSEKVCDDSQLAVKKKVTPLHISKFTKTLSEDERKKQFDASKLEVKTDTTLNVKKRVALISVPMGSKFPAKPEVTTKTSQDMDETKSSANLSNTISKSKSRINLLSSFIKRTEKTYSDPGMPVDVESAATETDTSVSTLEIKSEKKDKITSNENMDVDDFIELSD